MEKNAGSWGKFSEVLRQTPPGNNGNIGKWWIYILKKHGTAFDPFVHFFSCSGICQFQTQHLSLLLANFKSDSIDIWFIIWAPSSEFVSSSIPSWQTLTAHAQPFRGARDLAFCLKVPLDSLLVWASSEGSGEIARMRRLAWTFAARIGYKYQIRLTWSIWRCCYSVDYIMS